MPHQKYCGAPPPQQQLLQTDTNSLQSSSLLDANCTYLCTAYNSRCFIIQKVKKICFHMSDKIHYLN